MSDDTVDELKERVRELEDGLQSLKEQKRKEYTDSAAVDEESKEVHDQIRDEADQSGMSRRKFMKSIAGGGAALGAAAMMPSAAALDIESNNPFNYNENFSVDTQGNLDLQDKDISNVGSIGAASTTTAREVIGDRERVNVADEGADSTGSSDVSGVVEDLAGDNTLLVFPPGTYHFENRAELDGYDNLGIKFENATVTSGLDGVVFSIGGNTPVESLYFDGMHLDQTGTDEGARPLEAYINDRALIQNVMVEGKMTADVKGNGLTISTETEDAYVEVRNYRVPDGADKPSTASEPHGVLHTDASKGILRLVDCEFRGFPNNGLYSSTEDGLTFVERGEYYDSGISQIRFQSENCIAVGAKVGVTTDTYHGEPKGAAFRLRFGYSHKIINCYVTEWQTDETMIRMRDSAGSVLFQGLLVEEINGSGQLLVDHPNNSYPTQKLTMRDCEFYGDRGDVNQIFANINRAYEIDNCVFDFSTSTQTRGLRTNNLPSEARAVIRDTDIYSVGQYALQCESDGIEVYGGEIEADGSLNINVAAADVVIDMPARDPAVSDNGTRTIINGEATETADAEEPQETYPVGTFVDFTDSGDDSGTGYYRIKQDGSAVQVG